MDHSARRGTPAFRRPCRFVAETALCICLIAGVAGAGSNCGQWIFNPATGHHYRLTCEARTWGESRAEAIALGGDLAIVGDQAENDWIWNTFDTAVAGNQSFWIGLSDAAEEGTFRWVDGTIARMDGVDRTFTGWAPGEPNDLSGEDYVDIANKHSDRPHGTWNDDAAAVVLPGVIETSVPLWRLAGDFDNSGCPDLGDFLLLVDAWQQTSAEFATVPCGLSDFLALLANWQRGPGCF